MRREKPVISTTEPAEQPSAEAMATVSYHKGNNKSPLLSVSFRWHCSFTYMKLEFHPYGPRVPMGGGTAASRQKGAYDLSLVFSVLGEEMIEVLEANLGAG